jgi:hypothetical protein
MTMGIKKYSKQFIGAPYLLAPCGEGAGALFNQKPIFRTDGFDCVTYVNTVLAMHFSTSINEHDIWMRRLNYYGATPDYLKRFHFMSADWNVQNIEQGLISDVTPSMRNAAGDSVAHVAQAFINRQAWLARRSTDDLFFERALTDDALNLRLSELKASHVLHNEQACVNYIPFDVLLDIAGHLRPEMASQIPDVCILEIVRPNWDLTKNIGTHLNVSHVGFVLRDAGVLIFRHASPDAGCVVDVRLDTYLASCASQATIAGVFMAVVSS